MMLMMMMMLMMLIMMTMMIMIMIMMTMITMLFCSNGNLGCFLLSLLQSWLCCIPDLTQEHHLSQMKCAQVRMAGHQL
eukprot:7080204-Karenia_brevis.AAC.1